METRKDPNREDEKKRRTPIVDGDTRPDIDPDPETQSDDEKRAQKDTGKTTKNRVDTNSLEDFRDAKK